MEENVKRKSSTWSAHREGHHVRFSGWHAVKALSSQKGAAQAGALADVLAPVFKRWCATGKGCSLASGADEDHDTLLIGVEHAERTSTLPVNVMKNSL